MRGNVDVVTKDEKEDELVTRSSAMVIAWLRTHLKNEIRAALKELYAELWRDGIEYLIRERWVKILLVISSVCGLVVYLLKEYA